MKVLEELMGPLVLNRDSKTSCSWLETSELWLRMMEREWEGLESEPP